MVAAAAVTVCLIVGGVAVMRQPRANPVTPPPATSSPEPSATPSQTASPVVITDAMFLQPEDVGPGHRRVSDEGSSGDWTFEFSMSALNCPPPGPVRSPIARRDLGLHRGTPESEDFLTQYVAGYGPGDAARYLDEVRSRVAACRSDRGGSIAIGAERFAGDDSLLLVVDFGGGFTTKQVLVRHGELLTEFFTKPERSSAVAQELGRKAGQRLS